MNKLRVVTPLAVVVIGGLTYFAVSASTSNAQPRQDQQSADLKAKVERLQKQVEQLQNKVEQLERRPVPAQLNMQPVPSPYAQLSPTPQGPILMIPAPQGGRVPLGSTPFNFNGETYYLVPVEKGKQGFTSKLSK